MSPEFHQQEPLHIIDRIINKFPIKTYSLEQFVNIAERNNCIGAQAQVQETTVPLHPFAPTALRSLEITYLYGAQYVAKTRRGRKIVFREPYVECPDVNHEYELLAQSVITARHRLSPLRTRIPNLPVSYSVLVSGKQLQVDFEELIDYARRYQVVPFPVI